jgi:hypothetical protein
MPHTQVKNQQQQQQAEAAILSALASAQGRGKSGLDADQLLELNAAVEALEADGGVEGVYRMGWACMRVFSVVCNTQPPRCERWAIRCPAAFITPPHCADPTTLEQIDGRWKLLYTSRPGTASPIQVCGCQQFGGGVSAVLSAGGT